MKILIIIVFFYVFKLQAATWIEESVGNIISYEEMNLPDGSVYSISKGTGGGKDNTGKYASSECIGHRLEKNNALIELRYRLMQEENSEYLEAAKNKDLIEVADALGDMLYILCGTILTHGLQYKIEEVFNEIQRSNMSKLGKDGNPIYRNDGKVMKGPNYFKPDIYKILK